MSSQPFSITASPGTDVWRKPPSTNVYNAPTHPHPTRTSGPLSSFLSARITFTFPFLTASQYDQGGLLLSFRPSSSPASSPTSPPPKWIKTGLEFYNASPRLSTVSCSDWADWSVGDRSPDPAPAVGDGSKIWTTVSVEKQTDHHGQSFWVYRVMGDGTKVPLREITWIYAGGEEEVGKWEITVEALAARPDTEVSEGLVVEFRDFEVEWSK